MSSDALRGPYSMPIRYGDRTFHVGYRTDMVDNAEFQTIVAQVVAAGNRDEQKRLYCRGIAHVVAAWDVMGSDGRAVPITAEGVDALPEGLLRLVLHGCADHARRLAQDVAMRGAPGRASPPREQREG